MAAGDLDERGRTKAAAPGRVYLLIAQSGPRDADARAHPVVEVETVLRWVEQILVRETDVVKAADERRRERRGELPARPREHTHVHLVGAHGIGQRIPARRRDRVQAYHRMRVRAVHAAEPAERAASQPERTGELHGAPADSLVIPLARVGRARVHVELIRVQGPTE